jgi:acetyltransferase-like isoleucine patch superfamily enzyme
MIGRVLRGGWIRLWAPFAGTSVLGRAAAWLQASATPPYPGRRRLADLNERGFVAPSARIKHRGFHAGRNIFIDDRVLIFESGPGGAVVLGNKVRILRDGWFETDPETQIIIGDETFIQPRCLISAHKRSVRIGRRVQIAANCAFYSYDHGIAPDAPIWGQPLTSRGDIEVGDDSWLGYGVVVLSGVQIGSGAVIGAGAVVTRNIPAGAIAVGNPARVIGTRDGVKRHDAASPQSRLRM